MRLDGANGDARDRDSMPGSTAAWAVERRTADAVLRLMADLRLSEALSVLTVEALRNEIRLDDRGPPPSARTLARVFGARRSPSTFDRDRLLEAVLAWTVDDLLEATSRSAASFQQAADTIARGGGHQAFTSALHCALRAREPGSPDDEIYRRERLFHLALALSDEEPAITHALRRFHRGYGEMFDPVYTGLLDALDRQLAPGVSIEDLRLAIHAYLRGVIVHHRCGVHIDADRVASTTLRIIAGHTIAGNAHSPRGVKHP